MNRNGAEGPDGKLSTFSKTLIWALLVFSCFYAAGYFATGRPLPFPEDGDTRSSLEADYGEWSEVTFAPVSPALILELAEELGLEGVNTPRLVGQLLLPGTGRRQQPSPSPVPTDPPEPTRTPLPSPTATAMESPTSTAVPVLPSRTPTKKAPKPKSTNTATPTQTAVPTFTNTPGIGSPPTQTASPTFTNTPGIGSPPTQTPTSTPTFQITQIAAGAAEPDLGPPDGNLYSIPSGYGIVMDLSGNPIIVEPTPDADPEFIYYERQYDPANIHLDLVIIEISMNSSGDWHVAFNWGDQVPDANTNVFDHGNDADGEQDNEPVPLADLYGTPTPPLNTGISVDVEARVPTPGVYPWLRILSPHDDSAGDGIEFDAVEVLPTNTPPPPTAPPPTAPPPTAPPPPTNTPAPGPTATP